jgi:hypothetical protein
MAVWLVTPAFRSSAMMGAISAALAAARVWMASVASLRVFAVGLPPRVPPIEDAYFKSLALVDHVRPLIFRWCRQRGHVEPAPTSIRFAQQLNNPKPSISAECPGYGQSMMPFLLASTSSLQQYFRHDRAIIG